jgi:hypothetical protein
MLRKYPTYARLALLLFGWPLAGWAAEGAPLAVTVSVDGTNPGDFVPPPFSGLSYETSQELPGPDGRYFFSEDNVPLFTLFRTLGIRYLRVGGNTADRATTKIPDEADIDSLFEFARTAGVRVIYTVRLKQGDPKDAVRIAKYISDHYIQYLACFAIGNEPNVYSKTYTYEQYSADWKKIMTAILAELPGAVFCGPSATPGGGLWVRKFVAEYGPSRHIVFATYHSYPGGSGKKVTDPAAGRAKLLSPDLLNSYQKFADGFVPEVKAQKLNMNYRLEEANNYFNGGAKDVSDTFTSALWGLDYMYWWAEHGCWGINFHTVATAPYSAFVAKPGGIDVRPLAYGMKAFDLGSYGRFAPVHIDNPGNVNLTAYGVLGDDKSLIVTLINKETDAAKAAQVTIAATPSFANEETMMMTAPAGDIAAKTGITLGGAPIQSDGTWSGAWSGKRGAERNGDFLVTVPAASAAIVRLSRE